MAFVALLRGINVGGRNMVPMADLSAMFEELGYTGVGTLLQSGNVVFSGRGTPLSIEKRLEEATAERFGLGVSYFVRTAEELAKVAEANPLKDEARDDPSHLLVIFLKEPATAARALALREALEGPEVVRVQGRHAYVSFPAGIGKSKLTPALIEKHLGRGTGRNWNTVRKLLDAV